MWIRVTRLVMTYPPSNARGGAINLMMDASVGAVDAVHLTAHVQCDCGCQGVFQLSLEVETDTNAIGGGACS